MNHADMKHVEMKHVMMKYGDYFYFYRDLF